MLIDRSELCGMTKTA